MPPSPQELERIGREGVDALKRGDAATARARFEELLANGDNDPQTWLAAALARHAMGDIDAAHQALDEVFARDQQNLRALLLKADCYMADGDRRAAAPFYTAVVRMVPDLAAVPPQARQEIERAKAALAHYRNSMMAHLEDSIEQDGLPLSSASPRFIHSLDLLAEKKQRQLNPSEDYPEQPRAFYFPELPATGYYPRDPFPWLGDLEDAVDDIADELAKARENPDLFAPYIHAEGNRPVRNDHRNLDNADWSALFLWRDGELADGAEALFPKTLKALEAAPLEIIPGRSPIALFSKLAPGARIDPHTGFLNTRLICHLPIITPENCALRVAGETRSWKRGEAFVFNDTVEHEAWNNSDEERVVLICSVWRPELSQDETKYVSSLLQAVNSFS